MSRIIIYIQFRVFILLFCIMLGYKTIHYMLYLVEKKAWAFTLSQYSRHHNEGCVGCKKEHAVCVSLQVNDEMWMFAVRVVRGWWIISYFYVGSIVMLIHCLFRITICHSKLKPWSIRQQNEERSTNRKKQG